MVERDGLQIRGFLVRTAMYRRFYAPGLAHTDPDDPHFPLENPPAITTPGWPLVRPSGHVLAPLLRF